LLLRQQSLRRVRAIWKATVSATALVAAIIIAPPIPEKNDML
jgi:hypothetical protein